MTTWYWDPINGTDANASAGNGDSFATRRKKVSNFVAAATAPGDVIRCMKSPDPTSLGITATWTKAGAEMGSNNAAITSSTNATPIVITFNSGNYAILAPAVNDTVFVGSHTTNTNANGTWKISAIDAVNYKITLVNADGTNSVGNGVGGASGYVRNMKGATVELASALNKTISLTGNKGAKTNWTASANVTCTVLTTDFKEGVECQKIDIAAGFTTGLAAYWALPASTDFSTYRQISFWIKQTAGTTGAAGATQLKLCSDTAGVTAVDTFDIPVLSTGGAASRWTRITVDKGSALGAAIQSIAFYVVTDNGAQTFQLDNIIACKDSTSADSLSLTTPIGKNIATDSFYSIQSINGVRVMLDQDCNTIPDPTSTAQRGYRGVSETVTTYKRDTFKPDAPAAANTTTMATLQESGSVASKITYSGGWNSTDMSTQTGETWFDGQNGFGAFFYGGFSITNVAFEKFSFSNYHKPLYGFGTGLIDVNFGSTNNMNAGCDLSSCIGSTINVDFANNNAAAVTLASACTATFKTINGSTGVALALSDLNNVIISGGIEGTAAASGITYSGLGNSIVCPSIERGLSYGVTVGAYRDNKLIGATLANNSSGDVSAGNLGGNKFFMNRCTLSSTTKISYPSAAFLKDNGIYCASESNVQHADTIYMYGGAISKQSSVRHTASGHAWKLSPTNSTYFNSSAPMTFKVASWPVSSGIATTFKLWMYRDNTGMSARLVVRGGSVAGVDADVQSALMSEAINTWGGDGAAGPVTVAVTPTETGVVEVFVECWASSTTYSLYVDDFSVI